MNWSEAEIGGAKNKPDGALEKSNIKSQLLIRIYYRLVENDI